MRLKADYHTHTVHSHGMGSVKDNAEAAIAKGLESVGITDHSVSHFFYGVKNKRFGYYMSCIDDAKKAYADRIDIKSGIELNLTGFDGSFDMPEGYQFDTVILGYHKGAVYKDITSAWRFFTGHRRVNEVTKAYILAIQTGLIDIVSHPGYGVPVDYRMLAMACADYGTLFEVNEKHADLSAENIHEAASAGAKFVISSDAHHPEDVGEAPHAIALALKAGLTGSQIVNITED
ncbi:MAG: PHP domain-containing protein [Eubacteriales bacterium]|nr:PHP domain-containing protein [Eubacteriales bacterium]